MFLIWQKHFKAGKYFPSDYHFDQLATFRMEQCVCILFLSCQLFLVSHQQNGPATKSFFHVQSGQLKIPFLLPHRNFPIGNETAVISQQLKRQMWRDCSSIRRCLGRKKRELGVAHLTELFTLSLHSWETLAWFPKIGVFSSTVSLKKRKKKKHSPQQKTSSILKKLVRYPTLQVKNSLVKSPKASL